MVNNTNWWTSTSEKSSATNKYLCEKNICIILAIYPNDNHIPQHQEKHLYIQRCWLEMKQITQCLWKTIFHQNFALKVCAMLCQHLSWKSNYFCNKGTSWNLIAHRHTSSPLPCKHQTPSRDIPDWENADAENKQTPKKTNFFIHKKHFCNNSSMLPRHKSRRPGPLKIVPSQPTGHIQHLPHKVQTFVRIGFHGLRR